MSQSEYERVAREADRLRQDLLNIARASGMRTVHSNPGLRDAAIVLTAWEQFTGAKLSQTTFGVNSPAGRS